MKKKIVLAIALITALSSKAQIVLNYNNNAPSPWDYQEFVEVQKMMSPGNSGSNQNWNFSAIDTSSSRLLISKASQAQSAPDGVNLIDSINQWLQFKIYNDSVLLYNNVGNQNENPLVHLTFPLSYGGEINDDGKYTRTDMYGQYDIFTKRNIKVDGEGRITLPYNSAHAAIRVVTSDSIFENYCGMGGCFSATKIKQNYAWYDATNKYPIFQYTTLNTVGDAYVYHEYKYIENLASTVSSHEIENEYLSFYPNPAQQYIVVQQKDVQYSIRNVNGQILLSGKTTLDNEKTDVSSLSSGIYFIQFLDEKNQQNITQKLIKN
jgi:hypothetical protein